MYAALWKVLPGPFWAKLAQAIALTAAIAVVLVLYVFPFFADLFLAEESTIGSP